MVPNVVSGQQNVKSTGIDCSSQGPLRDSTLLVLEPLKPLACHGRRHERDMFGIASDGI